MLQFFLQCLKFMSSVFEGNSRLSLNLSPAVFIMRCCVLRNRKYQ
ncbi:hypothetical protein X975_09763, partial [Stegodyphus mimosarum]